MNSPRDPEASRVAQRILEYLRTHADAADTAEGIATWWLCGSPPLAVDVIERAMELLIAQGQAERQVLPDSRVIYRAAR